VTRYLLSIYQPDGPPPPPEFMAKVGADLSALNTELKAAGAWVFTGGLHDSGSSTVVRRRQSDVVITDGPYIEGKEHIGGFWIIDVPDLDAALIWAEKATTATTLPIEVRPFRDVPDY
jgi:hypothetical protein